MLGKQREGGLLELRWDAEKLWSVFLLLPFGTAVHFNFGRQVPKVVTQLRR